MALRKISGQPASVGASRCCCVKLSRIVKPCTSTGSALRLALRRLLQGPNLPCRHRNVELPLAVARVGHRQLLPYRHGPLEALQRRGQVALRKLRQSPILSWLTLGRAAIGVGRVGRRQPLADRQGRRVGSSGAVQVASRAMSRSPSRSWLTLRSRCQSALLGSAAASRSAIASVAGRPSAAGRSPARSARRRACRG